MTGIGIESSTGRDAIFDAATMTGGRIERSHLERSTFVGARAAHLTANRCHLTECDFRDAVLMRARFEPLANLTGVTFDGAKLLHAAIGYAPGASFINAIATGCQFVGAQVAGCDFRCASLVHADFTGADLTDANFAGANLTLAHLTAEQLLTARGWRTATLDPALRVIAEGLAATRSTGPQAAGR